MNGFCDWFQPSFVIDAATPLRNNHVAQAIRSTA
jgi:hypothetical protein